MLSSVSTGSPPFTVVKRDFDYIYPYTRGICFLCTYPGARMHNTFEIGRVLMIGVSISSKQDRG